jgi:hypothetical protein
MVVQMVKWCASDGERVLQMVKWWFRRYDGASDGKMVVQRVKWWF